MPKPTRLRPSAAALALIVVVLTRSLACGARFDPSPAPCPSDAAWSTTVPGTEGVDVGVDRSCNVDSHPGVTITKVDGKGLPKWSMPFNDPHRAKIDEALEKPCALVS